MIAVIDTSALIRLFIPDGLVPQGQEKFFIGVESGLNTAIAPELILAETANVLLKKERAGELSKEEGQQLLKDINDLPVRLFSHQEILVEAYEIGAKYGLTGYDALFLALAVRHSAAVFTADKKMMDAVKLLGLPMGMDQ